MLLMAEDSNSVRGVSRTRTGSITTTFGTVSRTAWLRLNFCERSVSVTPK
jgi:hypothetical protein